ncbi:MAG: PilW family protein [Pseudomonadota bacterium]
MRVRVVKASRGGQIGLSLIELMVALLLSSLLVVGIVQIFIGSNESFHLQKANARVQESGRIAMEMLTREVRNAGYFGCFPEKGIVNNLDEDDDGYDPAKHDINTRRAIQTTAPVTGQHGGSDNFRVARAEEPEGSGGDSIEMKVEDVPSSSNFQVNDTGTLEEGDIIVLTDCIGGDIVQVSNVQEGGGVIVANSGGSVSPGNSYDEGFDGCSGNNCPSRLYDDGTRINRITVNTFYVGPAGDNDETSALFRQDADGSSPDEMVRGITKMRVQYGVGTGESVSDWRDPSAMSSADWEDVRAVRISVLVHSPNDNVVDEPMTYCFPGEPWEGQDCDDTSNTEEASDHRFYRVYTATASVRNRL